MKRMVDWGDEGPLDRTLLRRPPVEAVVGENGRKTRRRPHEEKRSRRQVGVTFPSAAWKAAVLAQAEEWGLRTSDFMTFCVAVAMRAIEEGEVEAPGNRRGWEFYHRAAEQIELPWEPIHEGHEGHEGKG